MQILTIQPSVANTNSNGATCKKRAKISSNCFVYAVNRSLRFVDSGDGWDAENVVGRDLNRNGKSDRFFFVTEVLRC